MKNPKFWNSDGRNHVWIDGKSKRYSHYIWFLNTGYWPDWKNKKEAIHHINGNTADDRFENLQLMATGEHSRIENLGSTISEETKQKLREFNLGKRLSEETKRKMSLAQKGTPKSREHRKNISKSKMGKKNPMYGKKGPLHPRWIGD